MKHPRLGLIGCGVITQRILGGLRAILEDEGAQITAACDLDPEKTEAVAEALDKELLQTSSMDVLLEANDVDAVLIATPIALHLDQVSRALQAGKHVYTHKTLADTSEKCLELGDLARERRLKLAASPGQVLLPAYARARELIEGGALGVTVGIDISAEAAAHRFEEERADEDPGPGQAFSWEWYHQVERGGGPLQDMLVYPLAFLTEVLGEATSAAIIGRLLEPEIRWKGRVISASALDAYAGVLRFGNLPVTVRSSFSSNAARLPWGFVLIRGTEACLEIEKMNDREYRLYLRPNHGEASTEMLNAWDTKTAARYGDRECHVLTDIREFVRAIQEDRPIAGATASNAARVADAIVMMKTSAAAAGAWTYQEEV
ncbi:MAG: Gfo/Idh/MocA family oxidoreductase [Myxococcota bacterium]